MKVYIESLCGPLVWWVHMDSLHWEFIWEVYMESLYGYGTGSLYGKSLWIGYMGSLYGQPIWRGYMDSSYAPWIWTVAKAKASPAAGSQGQAIKAEPAEDRHKANAAPVRAPAAEACPFISKPMLCWVACLPDGTPCQPFIAGGLVSKAGPAPSTPQATASPRTPPSSGGGLSIYIYIYIYVYKYFGTPPIWMDNLYG